VSPVTRLSEGPPHPFPEDWYDLSDPTHFWFRWRLAALLAALADARIPLQAPLRVLEVGCGSGVLADQLERHTAWNVDGADLSMAALERCAPRRGEALYYDVTEERAELLGRYDVVVLFDVLEHLSAPREFLRSALAHLRPGGLLLVNVPALPALDSAYDRAAGHLRRYTRRTLATALDGLGLRMLSLRYWGLTLVPLLAARKVLLGRGGPDVIRRGFRPPHRAVNAALVGLMHLETRLLRAPWLGTSVLYAGTSRTGAPSQAR
jgi:2-polyprenyl-3-methyl-5-hydroxy-6-metoxy-1,4-benzoquinol methylase